MSNLIERLALCILVVGLAALLLLSLGLMPGVAKSAEPAQTPGKEEEKLSSLDFVRKAASGNLYEIRASQLAVERTGKQEVKEFARLMIKDHTKAAASLLKAVQEEDFAPSELLPEHRKMVDELEQARGEVFDEIYARQQLQIHDEAVVLFEQATETSEAAKLREFAKEMLPILRMHKQKAERVFGQRDRQIDKK